MAGAPPPPPPVSPTPRGLLGNIGLLSYALMQLAGQAVDATVLTPCADLISTSVVNPYVWSERVWESLKSIAPQRARDISRFLSIAIVKSLPVFSTESSSAWTDTAKRVQSHVFNVLSTRQGHDAIQDTVAAAIKTTHALSTPEVKEATAQFTSMVKSWIQTLATPEGQDMIDDVHNWVSHGADVAASAETSIFLFEIATHLCHALDAGQGSRDDAAATTSDADTVNSKLGSRNCSSDVINGHKTARDDLPKMEQRPNRKAALEESMLRKLGVRGPLVEPEEVLELPPAMTVNGESDEVLARAFESLDEGLVEEDEDADHAVEEDIEPWHPDQTHTNLRRRLHRQRLHQAIRTSPKVQLRTRALAKQWRQLQLQRRQEPAVRVAPTDQYVVRVLAWVIVAFIASVLLVVVLAMHRFLLA